MRIWHRLRLWLDSSLPAAAIPRPCSLQPRPQVQRLPEQPSHDWRPATAAIPAAGGSIAFHGEDSRGWDFKVQKALEHAKTLGLLPLPLDPKAPADLLLVVESKAFLQAQRGSAVEGKRWGAQ